MKTLIISWPFWWYTEGWWWFLQRIKAFFIHSLKALKLHIWLKYLFVPMFGMKDPASRMVSFVVRVLEILARLLLLGVVLILCGLVVVFWLILPPTTALLFINQFL